MGKERNLNMFSSHVMHWSRVRRYPIGSPVNPYTDRSTSGSLKCQLYFQARLGPV